MSKNEKSLKRGGGPYNDHKSVHSRDQEASEKGMVLIDEFTFPHCVFMLANNEMNADGCMYGYNKMAQFLQIDKKKHLGVTLILTPKWMFMSLIERPYHYESLLDIPGSKAENGVPLFLDGYAFNGVFNI